MHFIDGTSLPRDIATHLAVAQLVERLTVERIDINWSLVRFRLLGFFSSPTSRPLLNNSITLSLRDGEREEEK